MFSSQLKFFCNLFYLFPALGSILTGSRKSGIPERTGGQPSILAITWQKGIGRKMKAFHVKKLWWLESYWERVILNVLSFSLYRAEILSSFSPNEMRCSWSTPWKKCIVFVLGNIVVFEAEHEEKYLNWFDIWQWGIFCITCLILV